MQQPETTETVGKDERTQKYWRWHTVAQKYALGKKTCEKGWKGFGSSPDTSCAGYHAYFALLAGLDAVSSPDAHKAWYEDRLFATTLDKGRDYKPIVVVSGLATPAMAEIARRGSSEETELRIFDICPTPLLVSMEVLSLNPTDIIFQADARNLEQLQQAGNIKLGSCSAVVTDAFLTRFPPDQRATVIENWAKLLRPRDGAVITTWRIGNGKKEKPAKNYGDERDRRIFMANVVQRAEELQIPLNMDRLGAAYDYAGRMTSYSGETLEEIKAFMETYFRHVSITVSPPVYDVTMRKYARIWAKDSKIS